MDINIKTKLNDVVQEYLVERKAMFIPIACVATFMLVGYAAVDKEKPEILSNRIELPFGEELDLDIIDVVDNRDAREMINVEVVNSTLNTEQLGSYEVEVKATDQFSNEATKIIQVDIVDNTAPVIEVLGANEGYVIQVPVYGSNDIASYVRAIDNVDGDVTPFIETDVELDTSKIGFQTITLSVSDSSGNVAQETFEFAVSDMEPPKIELIEGENPVFDYGVDFNINSIAVITDNVDEEVNVAVEGEVNTHEEGIYPIKIIAKDAAGNVSEAKVNVEIRDMTAPEIILSETEITVDAGQPVNGKDYLVSAIDNKDGDVTDKVKISTVNTQTAGTKSITYTVNDQAGNVAEAVLTVNVNEVIVPVEGNPAASQTSNSAVGFAISRVGSAYRLGASGPNVFDCSGLMFWSFQQVGRTIPRTAAAQAAGGTSVSRSNLQPGDLVFFSATPGGRISHVGMYVGGGMMVHAGTPSTGVEYASINIMNYVTARRY